MRTTIIGFLFFLFLSNGYSQDLSYSVHGKYKHPINKEKLSDARSMSDIIPYYPSSWIDSYISAEISAISGGTTITATSPNNIFSEEQIKMLSSLDFGDEIVINIKYHLKNTGTHETGNGNMNYSATVVPETEAEYSDGYEQLTDYIKQNAINKISVEDTKDLQQAVVRFTVNEEGKITGAQISKSSGIPGVDKLLLEVINDMPEWRPAADSQGTKVKQEFEFTLSGPNDGC